MLYTSCLLALELGVALIKGVKLIVKQSEPAGVPQWRYLYTKLHRKMEWAWGWGRRNQPAQLVKDQKSPITKANDLLPQVILKKTQTEAKCQSNRVIRVCRFTNFRNAGQGCIWGHRGNEWPCWPQPRSADLHCPSQQCHPMIHSFLFCPSPSWPGFLPYLFWLIHSAYFKNCIYHFNHF